jgi:hypothetical protein
MLLNGEGAFFVQASESAILFHTVVEVHIVVDLPQSFRARSLKAAN